MTFEVVQRTRDGSIQRLGESNRAAGQWVRPVAIQAIRRYERRLATSLVNAGHLLAIVEACHENGADREP
jgi:hypothetical protein